MSKEIVRVCKICGRRWKCVPRRVNRSELCTKDCIQVCFSCFTPTNGLKKEDVINSRCYKLEDFKYKISSLI